MPEVGDSFSCRKGRSGGAEEARLRSAVSVNCHKINRMGLDLGAADPVPEFERDINLIPNPTGFQTIRQF